MEAQASIASRAGKKRFVVRPVAFGKIALILAAIVVLNSGALAQERPQMLVRNWDELSRSERSRALENYQRFRQLSPTEQHRLEDKYKKWQSLPDTEKDRIRRNYKLYLQMPKSQKDNFERLYEEWRSKSR